MNISKEDLAILRRCNGMFGNFIEELENGEECGEVDGEMTYCPGYTEGYSKEGIAELNELWEKGIEILDRLDAESAKDGSK